MCSQISFPILNSNTILKQFFDSNNNINGATNELGADTHNAFFNYFFSTYLSNAITPKFSNASLQTISTKTECQKSVIEMPDCYEYNCQPTSSISKNVNAPLYDVFLGGSCGDTVWRQDLVIPYLKKRGITYYDPQRPVWSENLVHEEAVAKENSKLFLFVLYPGNVNATSFIEIAYLVARKAPKLVVVFLGQREWSDKAHPMDLPDRIRTCDLLEAILKRHSVPMLSSITNALDCVDEIIIGKQNWQSAISNPLQRITYLQIKFFQCVRMFCQIYKQWCIKLQTQFQLYLRRVAGLIFAETVLAFCLITFVFNSSPVWEIVATFIAFDYLLIIIAIIYSKFKKIQKQEKFSKKLIITGTPIPKLTESASLLQTSFTNSFPTTINNPISFLTTKIWNQTSFSMPYSTSMPLDILLQTKNYYGENETEKNNLKIKQKTKNQLSKKNGSLINLNQASLIINDYYKNGLTNNENEPKNNNNLHLNKKLLSQTTNLEFLNNENSKKLNLLLDNELQKNINCFNKCNKNLCTLCEKNNYVSYVKQRRETMPNLDKPDTNKTNINFVKPNLQIEFRKYLNNQNLLINKFVTSPIGYDVFLSCSSSNELEWITQKAVPQLHKSNLSYTSALMCNKEMRIPMLHTASHILYYIPSYKTFLSGMIEIAYFIGHWDWQVTVCVPKEAECLILLDEDEKRRNDPVNISTIKRRNECYRMAFCYLKDMARHRQCRVFTKVEDAIKHIANDKNCFDVMQKRCSGARLSQIVEKQHLVKNRPINSNNTIYQNPH